MLCDGWRLAAAGAAVAGITTGSAGMAGASTKSKVVVADVFLGVWDLGRPPLQAGARVPSAAAAGESRLWTHSAAAQFPSGTAVARRPESAAVIGFSGAVGSASWVPLASQTLLPLFHIFCVFQSTHAQMYRCSDPSGVLVCWAEKALLSTEINLLCKYFLIHVYLFNF